MSMLEVSHLKKYFTTQKAVDDISFKVEKGTIFGLLGPNGAGKTTLIRMITGIFYPDEGSIQFNGKKFNAEQDASRIGYMPEERGLYKKMKIGEQAVYLARLKGLSAADSLAQVKEWFVRFEMQSWWNKKIEDLSKGMAQKLQFVTTVLHRPELIILDEPFSGLDPVNANLIKDEIFRLAENGASIIFSTHRMEQVEEICNQIILVNKGTKILDGTVANVKQNYKENLFRITASPFPANPSGQLFEVITENAEGMTIRIKEGFKPNDVLRYFIDQQSYITGFSELLPSLNEIFIKLVEGTSLSRQFQPKQAQPMNKIGLIIRREYFTRIRNKTFLISTFLLPIVIILFIAGTIYLGIKGKTNHRVAVMDQNGYFKDYLKSDSSIFFDFSPAIDSLNYAEKNCSAVLIIPILEENQKTIYRLKYKKQLGLASIDDLEKRINGAITDHLIYSKTNLSRARLDSIRSSSDIAELQTFSDEGKKSQASSQGLSYGVGYVCGFLIYLLTFIYGAMVMRGVMEEKTSRIAEVIVSSVKPFQLMLGKIIGIGAVGLTQFFLWIIFFFSLFMVAQLFLPHDLMMEVGNMQRANAMGNAQMAQGSEAARQIFEIRQSIQHTNWPLIIGCFVFYFIGGYLFYASLFAAVGSVVNEDPQEAQSLMLPITMPIIFSFIIMSMAVQDPGGSLAVWASMIPFSSPIVMMARIPYGVPTGVPYWQLLLSMFTLAGGFLFTTWLAGKIYRTGILLYGKKPTWKTMWKWAFKKS